MLGLSKQWENKQWVEGCNKQTLNGGRNNISKYLLACLVLGVTGYDFLQDVFLTEVEHAGIEALLVFNLTASMNCKFST